MKIPSLLSLVLLTAVISSCNPKPAPDSQNDLNQIAKDSIDNDLASATLKNEFVEQAAIGGMMEVESSARMIKHTENPDIQTLATIMVKDHGAANAELKSIAKKEEIFFPQSLPAEKLAKINTLDSLQEETCNRFYADLMVEEHKAAIALFSAASESESNPEIRAFAKKHLPILKAHYAHAMNTQKIIHSIKNDKGDQTIKTSKDRQ
ncbi:DUF4142 domain-containing protein [Pedobacter insulae]|uniref:Putative membrane protein n=1 Tax=Pedobacter insulae TaxID=414048 RepID=A0A1I3A7K1_9SPHI|nr:DUF4142 domain-containing protein [Pedobacter insulae]SFH46067.1 putative membrane protein [Pedobacter insulae]